jgi:hypothetical protein
LMHVAFGFAIVTGALVIDAGRFGSLRFDVGDGWTGRRSRWRKRFEDGCARMIRIGSRSGSGT